MPPPPPTRPELRRSAGNGPLAAGIQFLDWTDPTSDEARDVARLAAWFDEHRLALGGGGPRVVTEPEARSVTLRPGSVHATHAAHAAGAFPRLLNAARRRVVDKLADFVASPSDDRFIHGAIFRGDARREGGQWVARPRMDSALSAIVLSLFATAILADRPTCEAEMCVCDTCGRVSFSRTPALRHACPLHVGQRSQTGPRGPSCDVDAPGTVPRAG